MIKTIDKDFLMDLFNKQCNKFKDNSSKPEELFKEQVLPYSTDEEEKEYYFSKDNWNSGQDIFRYTLINLWDSAHSKLILPGMIIKLIFKDDQWNGVLIDEDNRDIYTISWYKSRGATDLIQKNFENISMDDYIELLNILNSRDLLDFLEKGV